MDTTCAGEVGPQLAVKQGDPAQRHPHSHGSAQEDVWSNLEAFEIDVGLIEAVEEHQAVGAGEVQALGHVGEISEKGAKLDGHRDVDRSPDRFENVEIGLLQLHGRQIHVGGDV